MTKIPQTSDELKAHFYEQISFIKKSSLAFDSGEIFESKRLANPLRLLLHDTKYSRSLMGQLAIKDKLYFLNSSFEYNPKNLMPHLGLVEMNALRTEINSYAMKCEYLPLFSKFREKYRWSVFEDWWKNQVIVKDQIGNIFTRADLVLFVANNDGGAHVDPNIPEKDHKLKNNSVNFYYQNNGNHSRLGQIELVSIRQITFEFLESISGKLLY